MGKERGAMGAHQEGSLEAAMPKLRLQYEQE